MLDQLFLTVNSWMTGTIGLALVGSFLWGMVSVLFSPCHLASIPLIIAYVGGQNKIVEGRRAAIFAILFSLGLFLTIAMIGLLCALLGRMLGDVGPYWTVPVGLLLIWIAFDMLGATNKCTLPGGGLLAKLRIKGMRGAFILGLAYGVLSGSCTFGFIAPLLAIITVQEKIVTGLLLITLFAAGHCLPIAVAGSSTALIRKLLENSAMQRAGGWFRQGAGVLIGGLGLYFITRPFI
ncbi:MAG: cytochrome c biogenesis protein CcdA [Desulfocapsaceae bacterium]|nr:cytochrome c biogenesis protein CcdA [Desulfocapsaceae bacterium]